MKHSEVTLDREKKGQRHVSLDKRAGYGSHLQEHGSEASCAEHRL